jgi:hypothetical protein
VNYNAISRTSMLKNKIIPTRVTRWSFGTEVYCEPKISHYEDKGKGELYFWQSTMLKNLIWTSNNYFPLILTVQPLNSNMLADSWGRFYIKCPFLHLFTLSTLFP